MTGAGWVGGIIAAGEGTRLGGGPKPLCEVGGRPLIDHALARFARAGVSDVLVFARHPAVADHVRRAHPKVRVTVEATPSSAVTFRRVVEQLGAERAILTTVDTVGAEDAVERMLAAAERHDGALGLAVTEHVDDEKPLLVDWQDDGRITALGGARGRGATAGLYVVPRALLELDEAREAGPLRAVLAAWVGAGRPAFAVPIGPAIDVDRPEDVRAAEALPGAARGGSR